MRPDGPRFLQNPKGAQLPFRDAASRGLVEMNHRIANSLQLTVGYLRMQANELGGESAARQALNTAAARVSLTADLHRQISTHPDNLGVDLAAYLTILCRNLASSIGVEVAFAGEAVGVSFGTAHRIAQIVVELAINAGKHAGAGRRANRMALDLERPREQSRDALVQSCNRMVHGTEQRHRDAERATAQVGEIFRFGNLLSQPIGDMLQQGVAHMPPG